MFYIKSCISFGLREACAKVCLREACAVCARLARPNSLAPGLREDNASCILLTRDLVSI